VVAVTDSTGKLVMESILETEAATILQFFAGLRGTLAVTFEEGTWSAWLYDLLNPHVDKLVVCNPRKNALLKDGNKSDRIDACKLAELLRGNQLKPVYHGENGVRMLRELSRTYLTIVKDLSRVMNRLKAVYRSWAIPCAGRDVYYTVIEPNGWPRFGKPTCGDEPNDSMSNWTCCNTCVSKRGGNCWRRVESMPSPRS
jgi:transposase